MSYKLSLKVKLDPGAYLPEKAHPDDAGFDLRSREHRYIFEHDSAVFDTGVHIAIPKGYVGLLLSKSGLNMKQSITSEGVIDSGYTGSIHVKLYNNGDQYHVQKGDKISQLVIVPIPKIDLEVVEYLMDTERGSNGFGSTGR